MGIIGNAVNWVIDSLSSEDVIDLYFILSDLVDIPETDEQIGERQIGDAQSQGTRFGFRRNSKGGTYDESDISFGKQVF